MTTIGIYALDRSAMERDGSKTFRETAAWDTERGTWLEGSDGRTTGRFDTESLVDASAAEIRERFEEEFGRRSHYFIGEPGDVPGQIERAEAMVEPDTDLVEPRES